MICRVCDTTMRQLPDFDAKFMPHWCPCCGSICREITQTRTTVPVWMHPTMTAPSELRILLEYEGAEYTASILELKKFTVTGWSAHEALDALALKIRTELQADDQIFEALELSDDRSLTEWVYASPFPSDTEIYPLHLGRLNHVYDYSIRKR